MRNRDVIELERTRAAILADAEAALAILDEADEGERT